MKFQPKSEEECGRFKVLPEGEYAFEIFKASDEVSKKGNDMIKIVLKIFDGEECAAQVFDYLLEALAYKIRHCCDSVGLLKEYNLGELTAQMLLGCSGRVMLAIEQDQNGNDRNVVKDYVKRDNAQTDSENLPF
jgi:hypothetical protein